MWKELLSFLGIQKFETSPDGVFIQNADMEKLNAVSIENSKLKTDMTAKESALAAAIADKDAALLEKTSALAAKKTAEDNLVTANATIATQKTKIEEQAAKILGKPVQREKPADTGVTGNESDEKFSYTKTHGFNKK